MDQQTTVQQQFTELIETEPIRRIVELHPEVMPILAGHRLDLCCGGGHTILEAAQAHGLDAELITIQMAAVVAARARK